MFGLNKIIDKVSDKIVNRLNVNSIEVAITKEKEKVETVKSKQDNKEIKEKQKEEKKKLKDKLKKENEEINELVNNWQNTFGNLKNWNQEMNGFTLSHIEVHEYGCSARIYAPWGMDLKDLEKFTSIIETGCKCEFIHEIPAHNQFALAEFVKPEQVKINDIPFEPIKLKPYEFCAGLNIVGKPIIFDVNSASQILIAGQTRRGKNISCYISVVSWIYYCKPSQIMMYMFQGAKNDLSQFQDCEHVYCYTDKLIEMIIALEHINKEMERRKELFAPMIRKAEGNDNIFFYNKLHQSNQIPYIYVIIDEFIALMPDNTVDKQNVKDQKNQIMNYLQSIVQYGASYGVNVICVHQKPEIKLMPGFLKNMCNVRICFGFEDETCVQIVLGSGLIKKAHKLPPRKAYYSNNEQNGYLYTPNMKGRIKLYISQAIKPNHRTLFTDLEKLNSKSQIEIKNTYQGEENNQEIIHEDKGTAPLPKNTKDASLINSKKENNNTEFNQDKTIVTSLESKEQVLQTSVNPDSQKYDDIKLNIPKIPLEFNNVDPIKVISEQSIQQTLAESINAISDFIPFDPNFKPKIVIDETKLNTKKTEKPKKKIKEVIKDDNKNDTN